MENAVSDQVLDRLCAKLIWLAELSRRPPEPPLPREELQSFESQQGVRLPVEYRELVTRCSRNAPGPGYDGLRPPVLALQALAALKLGGDLRAPFRFTEGDDLDLQWDDEQGHYYGFPDGASPLDGTLYLIDTGSAGAYLLVLNGEERGRVWHFAPCAERELRATGQPFLAWYEQWLDQELATRTRAAEERLITCETLRHRIQAHPDEPAAYGELGHIYLSEGDRLRARPLLEQAQELGLMQPRLYDDLIRCYIEEGACQRALDLTLLAEDRLRLRGLLDPKAETWLAVRRGTALVLLGQPERALSDLRDALARATDSFMNAEAAHFLGRALAQSGHLQEALEQLRRFPLLPQDYLATASVLQQLGYYREEAIEYRSALSALQRSPPPGHRVRVQVDADAVRDLMAQAEAKARAAP